MPCGKIQCPQIMGKRCSGQIFLKLFFESKNFKAVVDLPPDTFVKRFN